MEQTKNGFGETIIVKEVDGQLYVKHSDISSRFKPISKLFMENILDADEVLAIHALSFRIGLNKEYKKLGKEFNPPPFQFGGKENMLTLSKRGAKSKGEK